MADLMNVFKALDKELAAKDSEIWLLKYELENLKKKLAEAETSKTTEKNESEVA